MRGALATALTVLIITSILKLLSILLPPPAPVHLAFASPNFVFPGLSERAVMIASVVMEVVLIVILLSQASPVMKFGTLAWLSLVLAVYHHIVVSVGGRPCHCMGIWRSILLSSSRITLVCAILLCLSAGIGLLTTCIRR
jgi:hypothetical protein